MKRLIVALSTVACVIAASAQTQTSTSTANAGDLEALKVQLQSQIGGKLDNLSPEIQNRLQTAKQNVEAARNQLRKMGPGDADAAKKQARADADKALGDAIKAMEQVSAQVKADVDKAKAEIQTQLQQRIQEAQQLQAQNKSKMQDGSGTGSSSSSGSSSGSAIGTGAGK